MVGFTCRGVIDLDFSIVNQGTIIKEFNIKNESDFPEYAKPMAWDQAKNEQCFPVALRDTLSLVMKQAVQVIVKTIKEQ